MDIQKLYNSRFHSGDKERKSGTWKEICAYLQKYVPEDKNNVIVDVAAGYCDFINNIVCDHGEKYAIDINPDVERYAGKDVKVIVDDINNLSSAFSGCPVTIFFMSNFLEHITKNEISDLLRCEYGLLEPMGEVWILTPNIRYVGGKYWDFFDHITPITEKAIIEEAEAIGFKVKKCIKRFLPYTTKSRLPQSDWIVRWYLRLMPLSGYFFGEQSFLILSKQ